MHQEGLAITEYRVQEYRTNQPLGGNQVHFDVGFQIKGHTGEKGNQKSSTSLTNMKVTLDTQVTVEYLFFGLTVSPLSTCWVESSDSFHFLGFPVFAPCRRKLCPEGRHPKGAPQGRPVRNAS